MTKTTEIMAVELISVRCTNVEVLGFHETMDRSTGQREQRKIWQESVLGRGEVLTGDREGSWLSRWGRPGLGWGLARNTMVFRGCVTSVLPSLKHHCLEPRGQGHSSCQAQSRSHESAREGVMAGDTEGVNRSIGTGLLQWLLSTPERARVTTRREKASTPH